LAKNLIWPHGIDKLFGCRAGYPLGKSPRKLDVTTILGRCDAVVMSFVIQPWSPTGKISGKTWRTTSRSIRLGLPERLRKASRTGTTFRQFAGFLTDLAHGAPQPKPRPPSPRSSSRYHFGTKILCESVDRALRRTIHPHPLSDRSHKLASTALAFDQPVADTCGVIVYGPQVPPNKI
jgi:hypothetical protein